MRLKNGAIGLEKRQRGSHSSLSERLSLSQFELRECTNAAHRESWRGGLVGEPQVSLWVSLSWENARMQHARGVGVGAWSSRLKERQRERERERERERLLVDLEGISGSVSCSMVFGGSLWTQNFEFGLCDWKLARLARRSGKEESHSSLSGRLSLSQFEMRECTNAAHRGKGFTFVSKSIG